MYARDFRRRAWANLAGKWGTPVVITLIVSLVSGALAFTGIGSVAILLLTGPITLGLTQVYLNIVRGGTVEIGDVFGGFKNFLNAFLLFLLNSIFIALWTLLLVIPGIIKSYAYSMSFYILADNPQIDVNAARKRSIQMMNGNKWRLFCLDFSFIGWYLLSALTFGILLYWVQPYHQTARAEFYQELLREQGVAGFNSYGTPDGATKSGGFGTQPEGQAANSGRYASAFGTGYRPDPDIELDGGKAKEQENFDFNKAPESVGRPDPDDQPPINADDL